MGYLKVTDPKGNVQLMAEHNASFLMKHNARLEPHKRFKLDNVEADTYQEALEKCGLVPNAEKTSPKKTSKK